jgi:hypothetical protein
LAETPPVAVCTECGDFTYDTAQIDRKCGSGKRCKGVYGSSVNKDDWEKCGRCENTGQMFGAPCLACQGSTWRYVGKVKSASYPWPLSLVLKHRV